MTSARPPRSKVRHGMATCARYGCERPECKRAHRIAKTRQEMDRAKGITGRVTVDRAARHIHQLLLAGMSIGDIAQRSGVSESSVRGINRGAYQRVYRTTQDAILGIPVPKAMTPPAIRGYIHGTGAQRRLQALSALGWTRAAIGRRAGLSARTIGDIRRAAQSGLFIDHYQAIVRVYEELWNERPEDHGVPANTASRLRAFAKRQGWPLPAELDDDLIDSRDALPKMTSAGTSGVALNRDERAAERREWIKRLMNNGHEASEIAERLGMGTNSVRAVIRELRTGKKRDRSPKQLVA